MALRSRGLKGNMCTRPGGQSPLDQTLSASTDKDKTGEKRSGRLMQKLQAPGVPVLSPEQWLQDRLRACKAGLITTSCA